MKTIGFIDYFLDEWHANEYPAMIRAYNERHGTDYQVKYAWAEKDASSGVTTDDWCEKYGAERCKTIEELCEKSDYVMVLSPSNPEKHYDYAEKVFACGKSPYIDKTFAPDLFTALSILGMAKRHKVKCFTTSALRYADELNAYMGTAKSVSTLGGGSNFEEYIIHQIEMGVKCLGVGAEKLRYYKKDDQEIVEVAYADGRNFSMTFAPALPFAALVVGADGRTSYAPIQSAFFDHLIADVIRFFETGETSFEHEQTLEVMSIRERAILAKQNYEEDAKN